MEELIQQFQEMGGDTEDAFSLAKSQRHLDPRNLNLRDAEHALFTMSRMQQSPLQGLLTALFLNPGYLALKAQQQNYPMLNPLTQLLSGMNVQQSTPPDLNELYWGMAPLWRNVGLKR